MKKCIIVILFSIFYSLFSKAQETPVTLEDQLENQTESEQLVAGDDGLLEELDQFKKNRINLNLASGDQLGALKLITGLQIQNLLSYRRLFGQLIDIHELQAVPCWDLSTIKKILPFVTLGAEHPLVESFFTRFTKGDHNLLFRLTQMLERSAGYDNTSAGAKYLGGPQRILLRYRYAYKNLLQFGAVADKDPGEPVFKAAQEIGFDFYSFHLFARNVGAIRSLALGDFTVNLGQGLIQWQSMAFKKSANVMGIQRQSAVIKPYHSAGEYYFFRGAGLTVNKGKTEMTAFVSSRKLTANVMKDSSANKEFITSFSTSGLHRTESENADRNSVSQMSFGGNVNYEGTGWHTGLNGIYFHYSLPLRKTPEPYNAFAIQGSDWWNCSLDYSYTYKNFHFFGEAAVDKNFHKALLNGLLIAVDSRVDLSILFRTLAKEYQAVSGNAFTENTAPTNETGWYAGVVILPKMGWRLHAYVDVYRFPWLRYQADAPSYGRDYLFQLNYTPNKRLEIYTRFKHQSKQSNQAANSAVSNELAFKTAKYWRTQWIYGVNADISLRSRVELAWFDRKGLAEQDGFLGFFDINYKPMLKPFAALLRLQYFETGGYDSRIYAYENDLQYSYSVPAFFDSGFRYYLNINVDIKKNLTIWLRWSQTLYGKPVVSGSGPDKITGNRRSEIRLQTRWIF